MRVMANCETEGYRRALRIQTSTFVLAVAGIVAAALVAQLPVLRALRRIDGARIVAERAL